MSRSRLAALLLTGLIGLSVIACGSGTQADQSGGEDDVPVVVVGQGTQQLPVTVDSADGRQVTVTDTSRIVPLWGSLAEIVFGLGLGENVVGRDISATFAEAAHLPLVTRAHDVSAESVLSLRPTIVLASETTGPADAMNHIRNVGVPVLVFREPASVEDIMPRIRTIAAALGVPDAGEELVAKTEGELARAKALVPAGAEKPRIAFLYMRGQAGVYLISGPDSGADSMIEAAGGIDAGTAMGLTQAFTPITSEALAQAAPDVILMTTTGLASVGGVEGLVKIPGIAQTPAGKNQRIVTVEDGLLFSFGPRTPVALEMLINQIYNGAPRPSPPLPPAPPRATCPRGLSAHRARVRTG